jgi:hypothetical protein
MAIKYTSLFPIQGPPKFSQVGIFLFENITSGNPAFALHDIVVTPLNRICASIATLWPHNKKFVCFKCKLQNT